MPGVNVTTATWFGNATVGQAPSSTFFVAGLTERGRTDKAYLVTSMAEFEAEFGTRVSYGTLHDTMRTFFEEGGLRAYVVRTVGAAATAGTRVLNDRAGTPQPTLRLDAKGAGAWSSGVTVAVAAGTLTGTFKITLAYGGVTEVYDNLTTPTQAAGAINQRSQWVTATDLGSATAAPNNQPAVSAATALSAGADDRASVVAATYIAALDARATRDLGDGVVAVPGQPSSSVGAGLIAHAVATRRLALLAAGAAATEADVIAAAGALRGTVGGEHAGIFYPWVKIPDGFGGTYTVSPEGYAAAVRARAHLEQGPERAPGGEISRASFVTDVVTPLGRTASDTLDAAGVNAIRAISGGGIRLYGWRSLSSDTNNYALLTGRDLLNYLVVEGERRLEQYVLRTVDPRGHLFAEIAAELIGLVEPIAVRGGLWPLVDDSGYQVDPGYDVDTGPSVNTPARLAAQEVWAKLGVRISPTGATINLLITKAGLTAAL